MTYEECKLSKDIEESLLRLNKYYNLNYSAIDLIQDKNDEIYFLELNPNGQYLWIEEELKLPISFNIASLLTGDNNLENESHYKPYKHDVLNTGILDLNES